jgi:hypothetical protein
MASILLVPEGAERRSIRPMDFSFKNDNIFL